MGAAADGDLAALLDETLGTASGCGPLLGAHAPVMACTSKVTGVVHGGSGGRMRAVVVCLGPTETERETETERRRGMEVQGASTVTIVDFLRVQIKTVLPNPLFSRHKTIVTTRLPESNPSRTSQSQNHSQIRRMRESLVTGSGVTLTWTLPSGVARCSTTRVACRLTTLERARPNSPVRCRRWLICWSSVHACTFEIRMCVDVTV